MKSITVKKLQDAFTGKVCTILTNTVAKQNFNDTQFADFFTGLIVSLDEDGIFAVHSITQCKNFYSWPHVVGILEEQVLNPENPEHAKVIEKIKKSPAPAMPPPPASSPYADLDTMTVLSQQAKKMVQKK